jgi:K+-sensing histidine kinase KdpD
MAQCIRKSGVRLHRRIEKFLTYADLSSQSKNNPANSEDQFAIEEDFIKAFLNDIVVESDRSKDVIYDLENSQIKADAEQYILILRELVENSIKFSQKGSGIIIMGRRNEKYYKTRVIDAGKGIPLKYLKEIGPFNMFSENKDTEEGSGLGLAIVKKLIELTDGYLKVESKENSITKIEFGIPLSDYPK